MTAGGTLSDAVTRAVEALRGAGIDNPPLDARLLIGHVLGVDRAQLLSQSERRLSQDESAAVEAVIARRARHEPVARIIGRREFWGLSFGMNEATLEPRPDSETLVDAVLKVGRAVNETPRILDLGTGTGCLLLSLLHEMPGATGLGIDIAPRAVEQALANAETLGLSARVDFCVGNWLDGVVGPFDVIVSNPPYIPDADIAGLMPEVRDYDPRVALAGGADGLGPYRFLIPRLRDVLTPGGSAIFEVGAGQAPDVAALFARHGFTAITTHRDLGGLDRCVAGTANL